MLDPGLVVMPRVRSQCLRCVRQPRAALDRGQVGGHFRKLAAALEQRSLDPAADIRGLDDPTGRVADPLAQLEGVREAAVADRREAGGQVGDDLVGLGAARLAVAEEPVVRQREELPGRVAGGGIERLRDRLRVLAGRVRDGERERAAAVRARRHLGRDVRRLAVERDPAGRCAGRDGPDHVARRGVELGQGRRAGVRNPDVAVRCDGDAARLLADREGTFQVPTRGIDLRHRPVRPVRHPHGVGADGDGGGLVPDARRADNRARGRIDARENARPTARSPRRCRLPRPRRPPRLRPRSAGPGFR